MSPYACDYGAGGAALFDIVNVQIWTRRRASAHPQGRFHSEHRHGLRPVQHGQGQLAAHQAWRPPKEPTLKELLAAKRGFPPGYLHESWTDYLYWDAQLEA